MYSVHFFFKWTHRTNRKTTYLFKAFYPCLFLMDTQDKRTNNIFIESILPLSFLNGYTGQTVKQHIHSNYSTHVFLNGHTGQTVKQHIDLKHSTHVFLMDTQDKQTNNIFIQSIPPLSF